MFYSRRSFLIIIGSIFGSKAFSLIRSSLNFSKNVGVPKQNLNFLNKVLAIPSSTTSSINLSNSIKKKVRVIVISDLNDNYGATTYSPEVIKSISLIKQSKPDLVLCAGDMIAGQKYSLTKKQIQAMWIAFDIHITSHLKQLKIPFGFSLGNHDASGAIHKNQLTFYKERILASQFWNNYQHIPELDFIDKGKFPFYYTFKQNSIFYLVLDASTHIISKEQLIWITNSLESLDSKQASLRFVIGHLPLYPIAVGRNNNGNFIKNGEKLQILLEKHDVHTYISGHQHSYYPGKKGNLELLYSGALGGGPRRLLNSKSPPVKTLTIIDISLPLKQTKYTTYSMSNLQILDIKTLPKSIGNIHRKDISSLKNI
ncbi:MAG: metallophosphoesterase [Candidatus Atelocyanobacterium thalassa]